MIDPDPRDVGRTVVYIGNRYPGAKPEYGVITSINPRTSHQTVFVRYGADVHSKATRLADLEWAS